MITYRIKISVIILLIIVITCIISKVIFSDKNDNLNKIIYWNRNKCPYIVGQTFEDEFNKHNIKYNNNKWDLYLPCSYDDPSKEINEMKIIKNAKYFIINNVDSMVAKDLLWINLVKYYGLNKTKTMIPSSYILYSPDDLKKFENEYNSNNIYIMKKNIQRQEGLKITNNKDEIINGINNNFVIVQELLQNPYIINGRKTNMRFYVLAVCQNNKLNIYVHQNGFMYYTKEHFIKNSLNPDVNITTGYIDRKVYETNPLTHKDLRDYLDNTDRNLSEIEYNILNKNLSISKIYFDRIYKLIHDIFVAFIDLICSPNKLSNNMTFQLFGIDIAVDNQLNPMVMEINKGPDMNAKDDRDSILKHKVVSDMLNIINIVNIKDNNEFIQVL